MSAFIVSEQQIELLAVTYVKNTYRGSDLTHEINRTAKLLWKENHKSVNFRYNGKTRTPNIKLKEFDYYQDLLTNFSKIEVYKLVQCYDYQTCEHDTYKKSKAKMIVNNLLIDLADDIICNLPEYDTAKWGL